MKKIWKTLVLLLLIANLFAVFWSGKAESEVYPLAVRVDALDQQRDVVRFADGAGIAWEIVGIEDWQIGDVAALLMDDSGTPDFVFDDRIVEARYGFSLFG